MFASNNKTIIMTTVYSKLNTRTNQNKIGYKWNIRRRYNNVN